MSQGGANSSSSGGGGGSGILTINTIGPDGVGDFTLSSPDGSINISESGNGLELSAAPVQEFFSAYLSAPTGNVTGDGTLYGPIVFDGVIVNSSSSYNPATGIYTVPVSGVYLFSSTVCFNGGSAATNQYLTLFQGSAYNYRSFQLTPVSASSNTEIFSATFMATMSAGDTIYVSALAGGGGLDVLLYGGAPVSAATTCLFSGFKVNYL